jgi:histidine triad (HIT) family protein
MASNNCVFCKIVKGESPASVELESDNVIAFKSINPAAEYHFLVAPKKHIREFVSMSEKDFSMFAEMAELIQAIVKKNQLSGAYKLIFNGGKYPEIKHLHCHVLGGELKEDYHEKT